MSDLCNEDFACNEMSDPRAMDRYSSCSAKLHSSDIGAVDISGLLKKPAASCSVQNMDLHMFIDRDKARSEGSGRGLSPKRKPCSPHCREKILGTSRDLRRRCLHFYTDCADCPDCCSSVARGSCCSVHGPPEELADTSPRCVKHRSSDDNPADVAASAADVAAAAADVADADVSEKIRTGSKSAIGPSDTADHPNERSSTVDAKSHSSRRSLYDVKSVGDVKAEPDEQHSATKQSDTDNAAVNEMLADADITVRSAPISQSLSKIAAEHVTAEQPSAVLGAAQTSTHSLFAALGSSGDAISDEDCWTIVEKATCGLVTLLIFVVFVAIYLQLTHRYFTGSAHNDI